MTEPPVAIPAGTPAVSTQYPALIVFVVLCFAAAGTGGFFSPDDWYASLNRPSYAPPNWVFGPVWTVLHLIMAVAGWLAWKSNVSAGKARVLTNVCCATAAERRMVSDLLRLASAGMGVVENK